MEAVLLNTAYLPNISYFYFLLNSDAVFIEACEHIEKQSYRNRCEILSANGLLSLSIPLMRGDGNEIVKGTRISYAERWQARHWTAITSAYRNAPYFDYFEEELRYFYENRFEFLFDYNMQLMQLVLKILRLQKNIQITESYQEKFNGNDLRHVIHPKLSAPPDAPQEPYYQVFAHKTGFVKNLSVIDLLFNKGLETTAYLSRKL